MVEHKIHSENAWVLEWTVHHMNEVPVPVIKVQIHSTHCALLKSRVNQVFLLSKKDLRSVILKFPASGDSVRVVIDIAIHLAKKADQGDVVFLCQFHGQG
jgi:hypothetical protein